MKDLTQNELFTSKVGEAIFEMGHVFESQTVLLANIKAYGGKSYQVHLFVTNNEDDFIDHDAPNLKYSDGEFTIID